MANDVTFRHPDYVAAYPDWVKVTDAAAGERAIKTKGDGYLPRPNPADKSNENTRRFEQYLLRAVYYNATGRTLSAFMGLAFGKWPEIQLPPGLDQFEKDVTGEGVSLVQHSQGTLSEVLRTGRGGILVDYPKTGGAVSVADQTQGGIQPTLSFYPATAITNWRTTKRGSKVLLSLVVLLETHEQDLGFEIQQETQYRVLKLRNDGYVVEIWRQVQSVDGRTKEWQMIGSPEEPLRGDGKRWQEIPFQFVGSKNNDSAVDPSPLLDIAVLNIAHYRNSADYEESVYMCGQAQPWMAGLDEQWRDHMEGQGIYFGSRAPFLLPAGGAAGLLQAESNGMVKEAMDQKQQLMASLGARLITPGSANAVARTASESNSDDVKAHSVLSLCCDNTSHAYVQALKWAAEFARAEGEIEFSIGTEFVTAVVDAQLLTALVAAVQAGRLPLSDFWAKLRSAGLIRSDKTDEEIREEISQEMPGLDLDEDDDDPQGSGEDA